MRGIGAISRGRSGFLIPVFGLMLLATGQARGDVLDDLTSPFKRIFAPQATQRPPEDPYLDCPRVDIIYGAAALRVYASGQSAESGALRHQVSIADAASECTRGPEGSVLVKVGVMGRALLGPSGSPGTVTAPVTVIVKRGETIIARRVRTVSVAIPPNGQQSFSVVEDGITVPPGDGDLTIQAGIGNTGSPEPQKASAKHKRR